MEGGDGRSGGGSPALPAVRHAACGPGRRLGWYPAHGPRPGGGPPGCEGGGGDDRGQRPLRQHCLAAGVWGVTVVGGDGDSGAVPRPCLPSGGPLAVRVGGRLSMYPASGPRPGAGPRAAHRTFQAKGEGSVVLRGGTATRSPSRRLFHRARCPRPRAAPEEAGSGPAATPSGVRFARLPGRRAPSAPCSTPRAALRAVLACAHRDSRTRSATERPANGTPGPIGRPVLTPRSR